MADRLPTRRRHRKRAGIRIGRPARSPAGSGRSPA